MAVSHASHAQFKTVGSQSRMSPLPEDDHHTTLDSHLVDTTLDTASEHVQVQGLSKAQVLGLSQAHPPPSYITDSGADRDSLQGPATSLRCQVVVAPPAPAATADTLPCCVSPPSAVEDRDGGVVEAQDASRDHSNPGPASTSSSSSITRPVTNIRCPEWFNSYAYPITDETWVTWSEDPEQWLPLNHSCDPNSWLEGLDLVARRDIQPGEQVTADYSTFTVHNLKPFTCTCGAERCRGTVGGSDYLQPWVEQLYGDHLSDYVRTKRHQHATMIMTTKTTDGAGL